jgi:hypothetical protein
MAVIQWQNYLAIIIVNIDNLIQDNFLAGYQLFAKKTGRGIR